MEYLEDLLLDEDGEHGGVRQQLSDELLDPGQEELHSSQQGHPLLRLPKPENSNYVTLLQPQHSDTVIYPHRAALVTSELIRHNPVVHQAWLVDRTFDSVWRENKRRGHSLVAFDELIECEQTPVPAPAVLRLQVQVDLIDYASPAAGKIVLYNGTQADCELSSVHQNTQTHKKI